ncbi:energy-coupling factor transport system ATP-binding protein [Desulfitispora alkaliphila]|uniref:energy-coupling factor transporter ATPase n=1 Tax=Desulfitispora alkaliphila TaxID=622674 RepID=UPI003D1E4860
MSKLIQLNNVKYRYNQENWALDGINLDINRGEFIAVLGANGSGKSTLGKHMNALLLPTQGQVIVDGISSHDQDSLWEIREKVGMVFQNPDNQIVATVVEEDVAFGLENLGLEPTIIRERVEEALSLVDMIEYRDRGPHFLSGGQKQRIAIAGIIAMKPKCIVLDEPTAMLDPVGRTEVMSTVKKLNQEEQMTVVHITHFMEEALMADRVVVMDRGRIVMGGRPREVFSQVDKVRSYGLDVPPIAELSQYLKGKGVTLPEGLMTVEELVEAL